MKAMIKDAGQRRLLLLIGALCLVVLSWLGQGDRASDEYLDASLLQASIAFASARALNALISVLQSTTISFSLFGGVAVTLGELLDPFNDLVEQYAYLMQWAIGSLLAQKILLGLVGQSLFKWLLTLSAGMLAAGLWWRDGRYAGVLLRLFLLVAFLRFALVAVVLVNGQVDHWYLASQSAEQIERLDRLPDEVEELGKGTSAEVTGFDRAAALSELNVRIAALDDRYQQLLLEQRDAAVAIEQERQQRRAMEQGKSWVERLNPLAELPPDSTLALVAQLNDRYESVKLELEDVEQQRTQAIAQRERLQQDSQSGWRGLGEKLSRAGDPQTYLAIKQALDDAVDGVLRVMTLFVLRTLLLPLLFLYLLLRGGRWLWRLDVERLLAVARRVPVVR
ncbi:MAG: hypothetical protein VW877_13630 [Pseudomonadaceae bacterium]